MDVKSEKFEFSKKLNVYVILFFFLSGMCSLIYQVTWTRILGLIFGHTTFAISTVIAAFMAGLAGGSYFIGRWVDNDSLIKRFIKKLGVSELFLMYGLLEGIVGIYCLLTPMLFDLIRIIYLNFPINNFYLTSIFRFILCIIVLIVPTFCMGGTLPVMSKFLIRNFNQFNSRLSQLYFINTFGAVFGTVLSGFFLLSVVGINSTLQFAAVINIGISVLIYFLNKRPENIYETISDNEVCFESDGVLEESQQFSLKDIRLLFVVFSFTGFAAMIYELSWTRALCLSLGSSTYAFSAMLATFLFGIALGSIIYGSLSKKYKFSVSTFGKIEIIIGFVCILIVPLLGWTPLIFLKLFPYVKNAYSLVIFADFLVCFIIMIIPTTMMGFVFPLVGKLYTKKVSEIGKSIGDIYAVNTIGCILGSAVTGFVFIPLIGVQNALKIAIMINVLGGIIILLNCYKRLFARVFLILVFVLLLVLMNIMPSWNNVIMSFGSAIYPAKYMKTDINKMVKEGKNFLVFHEDGISSTVSVIDYKGLISLRVNGKVDASTGGDMSTQLLLGFLPILYHENPQDVFIIGFGSGITAKAIIEFEGIKSVECAEIEPAVVKASRFFEKYNGNVLNNSKFKLMIADGRNALQSSKKQYDIIISEPSNPWISGVASLFTEDFYKVCKKSLKPKGVFCQWFHVYGMKPADVLMILNTFYKSFRYGEIYNSGSDLFLIGSNSLLFFDYDRYVDFYNSNKQFRNDLQGINVKSPDMLFTFYLTSRLNLEPLFINSKINNDDKNILEFSAPTSLYLETVKTNLEGLFKYKAGFFPDLINLSPSGKPSVDFYLKIIDFARLYKLDFEGVAISSALRDYPQNIKINIKLIEKLFNQNLMIQSEKALKELIAKFPSEPLGYYYLATLYEDQNMPLEAMENYYKAIKINSNNLEIKKRFIKFLISNKRYNEAGVVLDSLGNKTGNLTDIKYYKGIVLYNNGSHDEAKQIFNSVLIESSDDIFYLSGLFSLYKESRDINSLIEVGNKILTKEPDNMEVIVCLTEALREKGDLNTAGFYLNKGLTIDPYNINLRNQLQK